MKRGRKHFTKTFLIKKLQDAAVILGRSPGTRDLARLPNFPSRGAYRNHFGSVEKAKILAGLPPSIQGFNNPIVRAAWIKNRNPKYSLSNYQRTNHTIRFKVLHRDNFTCQYCGRTPADGAKLEVDHIIPVTNGGKKILDNLITACFDCNRGKHAKVLSNKPKKTPQRIAIKRINEALNNTQLSFIA